MKQKQQLSCQLQIFMVILILKSQHQNVSFLQFSVNTFMFFLLVNPQEILQLQLAILLYSNKKELKLLQSRFNYFTIHIMVQH